jgi:hypothetical protein
METYDYDFVNACLTPGEYVLHRCKPGKGRLFTSQDVFMIPFSILWCGFAFFWEITAIRSGAPFFFCLFGLPFVCVGLYMVFGRYIWTAYIRKHTAYVITNRRIIRRRGNRMDIQDGATMPAMHITQFPDGNGTITFGEQVYYRRNGRTYRQGQPFMLENIPDVMKVQQIIYGMEK